MGCELLGGPGRGTAVGAPCEEIIADRVASYVSWSCTANIPVQPFSALSAIFSPFQPLSVTVKCLLRTAFRGPESGEFCILSSVS